MTERYEQMIAGFANRLRGHGGWTLPERLEGAWLVDPWMIFQQQNPTALAVLQQFEMDNDYGMSWGQCCNAIARLV